VVSTSSSVYIAIAVTVVEVQHLLHSCNLLEGVLAHTWLRAEHVNRWGGSDDTTPTPYGHGLGILCLHVPCVNPSRCHVQLRAETKDAKSVPIRRWSRVIAAAPAVDMFCSEPSVSQDTFQ
jgi:hypothetical protein